MIIQPSFGGCLHLRIAIPIDKNCPSAVASILGLPLPIDKTILHWYAPTARSITKTAEERFHTLARGWLAYPVTPVAHATTAEERL